MAGVLRQLWHHFSERAPRQLRFTGAGRAVVVIALLAGLAAIHTGNNLLFFAWGLLLGAIAISGVLSEASLRRLHVAGTPHAPTAAGGEARVGSLARLALRLGNGSRFLPAYALQCTVDMHTDVAACQARVPLQLRLSARSEVQIFACFVPESRGLYRLHRLVARTCYPFGFFAKSRKLALSPPMQVWCFPRAVEVGALLRAVASRVGEAPLPQVGQGEDFFALRPHRPGDDTRRIAWRRSARAGRLMVIEKEAVVARQVVLQLEVQRQADRQASEHAIATLASLAEALLLRDFRVAVRSHGLQLLPLAGRRGRWDVLTALSRLNARTPLPELLPPLRQLPLVALVGAATAPAPMGALALALPPAPGAS